VRPRRTARPAAPFAARPVGRRWRGADQLDSALLDLEDSGDPIALVEEGLARLELPRRRLLAQAGGQPVERRHRSRLGALQQRHDLFKRLIGIGLDLGGGAVLDGVRDVGDGGLEAQRIALCGDAVDEAGGDDVDAGNAAAVEVIEVVQTARCAGASIA
jgi:hypothetical protein